MFDKMKQLMEFKKQAEVIKKELSESEMEVDQGRGIRVTINGAQDFRQITIDPARLVAEDKNGLEQDLLNAVNAAVKKSQEMATRKMSAVMPQF